LLCGLFCAFAPLRENIWKLDNPQILPKTLMFKRPESVLLVVYTRALDVLLLNRNTPPLGWWQSVTGSLEWGEEPRQAALREVFEETGIVADDVLLHATGVINRFEIVAENRHLYRPRGEAPVINTEHVLTLELPALVEIRLNPAEHRDFVWLPADEAVEKTDSSTNRDAILNLPGVKRGAGETITQ
jgi:dATP pyrophosphohydrolase